jgi:phosphoenolpyruvate carboxylase
MFKSPDPLQKEIQDLGTLLGQMIARDNNPDMLAKIEQIRKLGKDSRNDNGEAYQKLLQLFEASSDEDLFVFARSFASFLNLANIAEQEFFNSPEGEKLIADQSPDEGLIVRLKSSGIDPVRIRQAIEDLHIDLVLTAHPTEIIRRSMIQKYNEINHCLRGKPFGTQTKATTARLEELITQSWYSNEIRSQRPTPFDEAKWGFAVIEQPLWKAVPHFVKGLKSKIYDQLGIELPQTFCPVRFSSWMGGDRDGNPFVTAATTERVLLRARWQAAELFMRDVRGLIDELSMSKASSELLKITGNAEEPYRCLLKKLRLLLVESRQQLEQKLRIGEWDESLVIKSNEELLEPLELCYRSLIECNMAAVANGRLLDSLIRARCFGINLVRLDIRQHSDVHATAIAEIIEALGLGNYLEWDEEHKQQFLKEELKNNRPLLPFDWNPSTATTELLDTLKLLTRTNPDALGIYIISMASEVSDVLAVQLLFKTVGLPYKLPIAPLFETLNDLNAAEGVVCKLFDCNEYRQYMEEHQYVMIGYSDSAKDAGVLSAAWAQYQAQETLVRLCANRGIKLTLFHGRGGTIGRGGGPTHSAILSQPPGSLKGGFRVTEQGETIRMKFGTTKVAQNSLALYADAILEAMLIPPPQPQSEWREVMERLSECACRHYRAYVRDNPDFVRYFRQATPEPELGHLPLGSRPAKRKQDDSIESLRAIPWIFAWAQNRLVLPAWLGAAQAIKDLADAGEGTVLREMIKKWPFFCSRLSMLEMVMSKADTTISTLYDQYLVEEELRPVGEALRQQLKSDLEFVIDFCGKGELMQDLPWTLASIRRRATYMAPLHMMQIELLQRFRAVSENERNPSMVQAMMITIAGIAAGLRNTG